MFQTEPIVFLQSLNAEWVKVFMTWVGNESLFIIIPLIVMFGMRFRKGFLLIQLLLWTLVMADTLKHFFAMPRPFHVDSRVQILETWEGWSLLSTAFTGRGASGFFAPLDHEVVTAFRLHENQPYGFPSGHVSMTTALWGGIAILFRKPFLLCWTILMVALMTLSRMYMGSHFLADALGGTFFSGMFLFLMYQLSLRWPLLCRGILSSGVTQFVRFLPNLLLCCVLCLAPVVLFLFAQDIGSSLLGINIAFLLLLCQGLPDDAATVPKRMLRVCIGILVFFTTEVAVEVGIDLFGLHHRTMLGEFTEGFFPFFMVLWGTVTICRHLGLYRRERLEYGNGHVAKESLEHKRK
jgi:membrane-associated phospholipid phosphatase